MLTVQQVAEMKGVDARTVRGWIQRGLIDAQQINPRLWLIPSDQAEAFQLPTAGRPSKKSSKKGRKK